MTEEELRAEMQKRIASVKPKALGLVQVVLDAYEQGFNDCFEIMQEKDNKR